ncbi:MAG: CHAD domain-containing protein [Gammaproteobacteria bacterium]|nr:MAG: CHAD domain-containing protein [Gammaproteobacteria bacterium]
MPKSTPRGDSLALALRARALAYAVEVDAQLVRAGQGRHTGVHRARKAMARLRALLALLHAAATPTTHLEHRLRTIAHGLSRLRDAQAAYNTARRLGGTKRNADEFEAWRGVKDAVGVDRDRLLDAGLRADPAFTGRRNRFAGLQAAIDAIDWRAVERSDINAGLDRSLRRARRARKQAQGTSAQESRHRLRRRMRRALLQIDLLHDIADDAQHPRAAKQARKRMADESLHRHARKRLVDALGEERDLHLLRRALSRLPRTSAIDSALHALDQRLRLAIAASDKLID